MRRLHSQTYELQTKTCSFCNVKIYQETRAKINLLKIFSLNLQAAVLEWKRTTKIEI